MHARKYRYDETFIAPSTERNAEQDQPKTADLQAIGDGGGAYVPSPARELQNELAQKINQPVLQPDTEKLSGLSSMLVIIGSCALLWTGLVALGFLIFG